MEKKEGSLLKKDTDDVIDLHDICGSALIYDASLNKGTAFTDAERKAFDLQARLPDRIETLDEQVKRCYFQYQEKATDLMKNIYLHALRNANETLFYKLITTHLVEMLPIIYTPTVGLAVQQYSSEFRHTRGLFLTMKHRGAIRQMLQNRRDSDIDIILVTDGEGVLGLGDQGVGGMDIAVAKLMVYTLCAGVPPNRVLPIQLDVGTNNEQLLADPLYLGCRHERVSRHKYDEFVDEFVSAVKQVFPNTFLHWEDFGRENARRFLERYQNKLPTFNDDMQGTGATVLACLLAATRAVKRPLVEQRIVIFGAGTAGMGIADQIFATLCEHGLTPTAAANCFWLIDRDGLIVSDEQRAGECQQVYARSASEYDGWSLDRDDYIGLYDVINHVKPTVLIGCSGVHGAFSERSIKKMAEAVKQPIIFPLSNPTALAEATPKQILHWTEGRALIAAGSPFDPVNYNGKMIRIAQANNAFVFPGIGLAVVVAQIQSLTEPLVRVAAQRLSELSPVLDDEDPALLPSLEDIEMVSQEIAYAVSEAAIAAGLSSVDNIRKKIADYFWRPIYRQYRRSHAE